MRFERLANRHRDAVYRQMVRYCGNYDDADDALAEALLEAYRSIDRLRDAGAFQGWLAVIARRACRRIKLDDRLRAAVGLENREDVAAPDAGPHDQAEVAELKQCVRQAVEELPPGQREVYTLREVLGYSDKETAKRLGVGVGAVKARLHRARRAVRRSIDKALCAE